MIVISMLLLFFKWVPPFLYVSPFEGLRENLSMFVFPALVVGVNSAALVLRMTRSSMLEVLRDDYIRTARAKGLAETTVLVRHAVRNALIPVVTVIGLQVPLMIGSMVVVETVFNLPGASRFMTDGIRGRDYNLVQGIVLLTGVFVVFSNLLTDIVYAWLNPRVRYQ
jgi:peptide/nickel transport system permease protein